MPDTHPFRASARPGHRTDPHPLYARLRETPVTREDEETIIVSTYAEIRGLLRGPRLSSDIAPRCVAARTGAAPAEDRQYCRLGLLDWRGNFSRARQNPTGRRPCAVSF